MVKGLKTLSFPFSPSEHKLVYKIQDIRYKISYDTTVPRARKRAGENMISTIARKSARRSVAGGVSRSLTSAAAATAGSWPPSETAFVLDTNVAYSDIPRKNSSSVSAPVLFLHGNPTCSYLWRNIVPIVSKSTGARCLAPDLVGMGRSGESQTKEPARYTLSDHANHVAAFIDKVLGSESKVHLVIHDWGSALGFNWACCNPDRVASITFMEAVTHEFPTWADFPDSGRKIFQAMREPGAGEVIVLEKNTFVRKILPSSVVRDLGEEEMAVYNERYAGSEEARLPTLKWPREIPIEGKPAEAASLVSRYNAFMRDAAGKSRDIPKLYVDCEPGFFAPSNRVEVKSCECLGSLEEKGGGRKIGELANWLTRVCVCYLWNCAGPNTEITGPIHGIHFVQEDSAEEIGEMISRFISVHEGK